MALKIIAGILAVTLMLIYLAPIVLKLRDPALTVVVTAGIVMMLIDLWQSLKSREE